MSAGQSVGQSPSAYTRRIRFAYRTLFGTQCPCCPQPPGCRTRAYTITRESVILLISPKHAIITGTGLPSCPWLLLQGDTRSTEVYQLKYIRADTAYSRALRLIQQRRTVIQNRARVHHERAPQDRQSESIRPGYASSFEVTSRCHNTQFRTVTRLIVRNATSSFRAR